MPRGSGGRGCNIRFAGFIAVICIPRLAGSDRGIINQLQEMLSVAGNDGQLFTVLTQSIELVGESSLEFLAGDVGELGFCDERFGFGTDELLLEDNDAGRVWFLVFQLGDLIGDFLFAVTTGLDRGFDVPDALDGNAVLVVAVDELIFELADFVDQNPEFVGDIRDVVIARFTPNG